MGHAAMDVLTLGLWEVVGSPVEGPQGDKYQAFVTYSADGTVQNVSTQKGAVELPPLRYMEEFATGPRQFC